MYRKLYLALAVIALAAASCAPVAQPPSTTEPNGQPAATETSPDDPVTGVPGETAQPGGESWEPQPGDEDLIRQEVEITSKEILTLESFPPQFNVHITGTKGNPCAMLRVVTNEPDLEGRIDIEVYVIVDPAAVCIQVLETFEITVPLGSLTAGEYSVYVNDELTGELVAP